MKLWSSVAILLFSVSVVSFCFSAFAEPTVTEDKPAATETQTEQETKTEEKEKEANEETKANDAEERTSKASVDENKAAKKRSPVPKNINDGYLDPKMKPEDWVKRFEIESREIFSSRKNIVAALHLKEGDCIADIGAGTGLFERLLSQSVGPKGIVYAVDISPRMIDHMKTRIKKESLKNVRVILSTQESTKLPKDSVDTVFICDVYHHFEYHLQMLLSIRRALRPGGQLVLIDFNRIPGKSRPWLLKHVRAGKEQFAKEIMQAGFRLKEDVKVPGLKENYFLRFEVPVKSNRK